MNSPHGPAMHRQSNLDRDLFRGGRRNFTLLFFMFLMWACWHSARSHDASTFAYVGPGAGFAFLGSFLSLVPGALLGAFSLLTWPVRIAWRSLRRGRAFRHATVHQLIFLGLDGLDPR